MKWNSGRLPGVATPGIEPYAALSSNSREGERKSEGERVTRGVSPGTTVTVTFSGIHDYYNYIDTYVKSSDITILIVSFN